MNKREMQAGLSVRTGRAQPVGDGRFQTIFENAPVMIDSFDKDGNCILWNRECVNRLGYTTEELRAADDPLALFYPDPADRDRARANIERADGVFREYTVRAKSGAVRAQLWADFRLPDGTIISVGHDITDRKRADQARRESEEKYRQIFTEAHDGIVLIDFETGLIADCNPEFETQTGRTLADLRSMTIREITAPESREYCKQLIYDVMADGSGSTATSLCRPDGGTTDVDVRARRVTIQGRSYLQGLARDITAARTAERALREKDTRLRLVVQQTPAILWTTDRDLCFTSSEGSGLGALGLRPGGVVGKSLYEFFQTDDPDFLAIAVHRQALNGVSASYETVWDGRVFESHTEPLRDENGEIIGTVGIALDISERKRAEQQLKESEQKLRALALRLQKVRDDESASLAREFHDEIGQSLSALKMDIGWSLRRVAELDRAQRCMPIISRLESMAADVDATIKRVRAISTELRPVILDHAGLLRALEWQAGVFQERTGITCDFIIETSEDLHLDGDRSTTLFRIFQEILTNVGLHAHARHVAIKLDRENGSLVLDVADDGLGIKQSDLCGAQALGILGMRERARVFDGEVSIRRRNGRGTRVVVRIPLSENA